MTEMILATKLYVPPARPTWVVRPRLLEKLTASRASGCRLALVVAPPGFGKTTLVTTWIAALRETEPGARVAWLSLDASDNDPAVFLAYLIAALRTCCPDLGEVTRTLLDQAPLPPAETLLLPLVNDLACLDQPQILVLDDYHAIQKPVVHELLAFLIDHLPPCVQLVITTRTDPLLPVARWRARGQLAEIRLKDLRFLEEEAAEFLNLSMGFQLKPGDVAALESRTEGWIAGLQLAAVSLLQSNAAGDQEALSGFVQSFAGNDRYVMDYLLDEVLARQPEDVQTFLLRTSILERFNTGLCETLLEGEGDPEHVLDYLDRANLFLIPLDNRREWYRYHHLFADLLQYRLRVSEGKAAVANLKRRAAGWFDQNEYPDEAIHYAQSAVDWGLCGRLLLKYIPVLLERGETVTVLRWLGDTPDSIVRADPVLCRYYGYVLSVTARLDLGDVYLKLAAQGLPDDPVHQGGTLAFACFNANFRGNFNKQIEQARQALALLPADEPWLRGIAAVGLGLGLCHAGDPDGCIQAMQEAYNAGLQSNLLRICVQALTYLGRMSVLRLDFALAERYFREAAQYRVDGRPYPMADIALFDLAQMKYEQNDLDLSRQFVEQGLEVNQRSGSIEMRAYAYRLAARLCQLRGEMDAARDSLGKALRMAADYNLSPLTLSLNGAMQVEMALAEGDRHAAEAAAPRVINSLGVYSFDVYPERARARLLIEQERMEEARDLLAPALPRTDQPGWEFPRLQMRVLQALAESDPAKARAYLLEALNLARPANAMRAFLDLGAPMLDRLNSLRPHLKAGESAFADALLAAFKAESGEEARPAGGAGAAPEVLAQRANAALVEPLTERELEVLRLLADGLSNAEIAQRLYLSTNTLKAHTQNIYSKLDVHSRVQVVNRARELGIIA